MKKMFFTKGIVVASLMFGLAVVPALFAEEKKEEKKGEKKAEAPKPKPQSVFKDKALEEGVRKFVFAKRYNKEPLVEADLIHLSTIKVTNAGINPLPVQRPIPIWLGGGEERVIRRIGKMADGHGEIG